MSEYLKNLVTHIRPELLVKWFAVGGLAFLGAITYDYATKGSDIFFDDGETEDLLMHHAKQTLPDESDESYLTLNMEE